jgi:MraZ protein
MGGVSQLAFDTAGRVTLPETLCEEFGIGPGDWVAVVGLRERFQIWPKAAFEARKREQRQFARDGLPAFRAQQRAARLGAAE